MTNLYGATTEIHHDAQKHPFGKRLSAAKISIQEYADWIGAHAQIYKVLDTYLPPCLKRSQDLLLDQLSLLPIVPHHSIAVEEFLSEVKTAADIGGLAYTIIGANLRGGQLIRKQLEVLGISCKYLDFSPENLEAGERWLKEMRSYPGAAAGAKRAFKAVVKVMDEIESRK